MRHWADGSGREGPLVHAHDIWELARGRFGGGGDEVGEGELAVVRAEFGGGRVSVLRREGDLGGLEGELEEVKVGGELGGDVDVYAADYGVVFVFIVGERVCDGGGCFVGRDGGVAAGGQGRQGVIDWFAFDANVARY